MASPIDFFRELLEMNPRERQSALANRSPESQRRILAKLHEYESLKPEECKLRLQVTELHYYLVRFLATPATNRLAQLKLVPEEPRKLVQSRLEQWDSLPDELKQRLLENEATIRYFTERAVHSVPMPGRSPEALPPADQEKLEQSMHRWQSLSVEERRVIVKHFKEIFELSPEEKANVLARLSEPERRQIEKTLESFEKLPPMQRIQCMRSFEKFAGLSREERRQFLTDASRWEVMSPTQRQTWRDLVYSLSHGPPLPPGLGGPPRPPLPPKRPDTAQVSGTN
jgi:hypothetical protein